MLRIAVRLLPTTVSVYDSGQHRWLSGEHTSLPEWLCCRTIPLREQVRRIAYQRSTRTFGIITLSSARDCSSVKVLAQGSWDVVAELQLQQEELGTAVCSCVHPNNPDVEVSSYSRCRDGALISMTLFELTLTDCSTRIQVRVRAANTACPDVQYYVVGTGIVKQEESEPRAGRILVLQLTATSVNSWDMRVLMEQAVNGAAYAVVPIPECPGRLAVTVNAQVCVFGINPANTESILTLRCKTKGQVVALYAAVKGRSIIVGDLMKSIGMYQYNEEQDTLTHVAKEFDGAILK